jgi:flagellar basal-body rod protein FlgB
MDIKEPALNQMLKAQMRYATQRQTALATNVANIDTPGYKAVDVKKPDFASMASPTTMGKLGMAATSPKHLQGTLGGAGKLATMADKHTFEISPTQNNVVLEDQMAKISDTGAQFQMSSTMLKKYTQLYRSALGTR